MQPDIVSMQIQPRAGNCSNAGHNDGSSSLRRYERRTLLLPLLLTLILCTFLTLITAAVAAAALSSSSHAAAAASSSEDLVYDFVVVGGGSTGSIVAARLAQAGWQVLLLEAGGATQAHLGGDEVQRGWKALIQEQEQEQEQEHAADAAAAENATQQDSLRLQSPPTVFDVPLEWHTVLSSPSVARRFEWELPEEPRPAIARALGGCSIHNAMIYLRGIQLDFDGTTSNTTDSSWPTNWSFEDVLPFYRRTVSQRDATLASLPHHAPDRLAGDRGGEVYLSSLHPDDIDGFSRHVLQAWTSSSANNATEAPALPRLEDMNDPQRGEGVGLYQFLIRDGKRDTAAQALYGTQLPAAGGEGGEISSTLHVRTNVQATRLVFEDDDDDDAAGGSKKHSQKNTKKKTNAKKTTKKVPRVVGVEVVVFKDGSYATTSAWGGSGGDSSSDQVPRGASASPPHSAPFIVRARREVIVSAGAINTPKLLLLSGIGPAPESEAESESGEAAADNKVESLIPHVATLSGVGHNLMDGAKVLLQFRAAKNLRFRPCMFEKEKHHRHHHQPHQQHLNESVVEEESRQTKQHERRCVAQRMKWIRGQLEAETRAAKLAAGNSSSSSALAPSAQEISYGEFGTPGFAVGAFLRSNPKLLMPNIQLTVYPFDMAHRDWPAAAAAAASATDQEDHNQVDMTGITADGEGVVSVEVILNSPRSRGSVKLRPRPALSANSTSTDHKRSHGHRSHHHNRAHHSDSTSDRISYALLPPLVHIASFDELGDVDDMVDAVGLVRGLMSSEGLGEYVGGELLPGRDLTGGQLRDFIRCGPRAFRAPGVDCEGAQRMVGHLAGTASMGGKRVHVADRRDPSENAADDGEEEDDGSVVDPTLRVHGVLGLRVADASVMPVLPSGNTHATCIMIGERASEFILQTHGAPPPPPSKSRAHTTASSHSHHHTTTTPATTNGFLNVIRDMPCPLPHGHCHIPSLDDDPVVVAATAAAAAASSLPGVASAAAPASSSSSSLSSDLLDDDDSPVPAEVAVMHEKPSAHRTSSDSGDGGGAPGGSPNHRYGHPGTHRRLRSASSLLLFLMGAVTILLVWLLMRHVSANGAGAATAAGYEPILTAQQEDVERKWKEILLEQQRENA